MYGKGRARAEQKVRTGAPLKTPLKSPEKCVERHILRGQLKNMPLFAVSLKNSVSCGILQGEFINLNVNKYRIRGRLSASP